MTEPTNPTPRFWELVFPGLGIGLLVGFLVGLSMTPVVAGLLTTLGGLLAAILGLQGEGGGILPRMRLNGPRIGSFGLACVLGVLGGMTVRVREVLDIPLKQQVANWKDAGFGDDEAKRMVALQKGLQVDKGSGKIEAVSGDLQKSRMSILFSSEGESDLCDKIGLAQYGDTPEEAAPKLLGIYHNLIRTDSSGNTAPLYRKMDKLAGWLEKQPLASQGAALKSVEEMVCAIQAIR